MSGADIVHQMRVNAVLAFNQNRLEEGFIYYAQCLHATAEKCNVLEHDDLKLVLSGAIDCITRIESDILLWDSEIIRVLVALVENERFSDIRALMIELPFLRRAWFEEPVDISAEPQRELAALAEEMDALFNKEPLTDSGQTMKVSRLSNLSRRWRAKRQFGQALVCAAEAVKSSKEAKEKASAAAAISKPIDQRILERQEEEFICKCHVNALYEFGQTLLALGMFYKSGRVDFANNFFTRANIAYQSGLDELRAFELGGQETRKFLNRLTQTDALLKRSWRTAVHALQCQFFSSEFSHLLVILVQAMLVFSVLGVATSFMRGSYLFLIDPAIFVGWCLLILAMLLAILYFWLHSLPLWKTVWKHECAILIVASISFYTSFQYGIDVGFMVFSLCAQRQDVDRRTESLANLAFEFKIPNVFVLTPELASLIASSSVKSQTKEPVRTARADLNRSLFENEERAQTLWDIQTSKQIEQLLKVSRKPDAKTAKLVVYDCLFGDHWRNPDVFGPSKSIDELTECRRVFEQSDEMSDEAYPLVLFLLAEKRRYEAPNSSTNASYYEFANWFELNKYSKLSKDQQHNLIYPIIKTASIFLTSKDYARARDLFSVAIKLNNVQFSSPNQQLLQSELLADLGQVDSSLSDYDGATRAFKEALKGINKNDKRGRFPHLISDDYQQICGAQIQMLIKRGDYLHAVKSYENLVPLGSAWNKACDHLR